MLRQAISHRMLLIMTCAALVSLLSMPGLALANTANQQGQGPQSVTLSYFHGTAHPGYILLEWEVTSEVDVQGYSIQRNTENNPFSGTNLTTIASFIPAQHPGSANPAQYYLEDTTNLQPGTTYYYWLTDFNDSMVPTLHTDPSLVPVVPYCSIYDINCNLSVDTPDITLIAGAWNCAVPDACYVERYDLNGNYRIDIEDVMDVTPHWGCAWAAPCYW